MHSRHGISLIETMIVIAIFAMSAAVSVPLLSLYSDRQTLASVSTELLQTVRRAQARSLGGMLGKTWGIAVEDDAYVLFPGRSYVSGVTEGAERHDMPSSFRVCTDATNAQIVFPISTTMVNQQYFLRLVTRSGQDERFILIDTTGSVRLEREHPEGKTCDADEGN